MQKPIDAEPDYSNTENEADRLRGVATSDAMSVELVSAFAGDRKLTKDEKALIDEQQDLRGVVFYSDLLYAVTHHYFAPEIAGDLWAAVIGHKFSMSRLLGRNVRITVAALDYLSNITSQLETPTLISEDYVSEIASLSMRDGLTGLFNHSTCYELLELEYRNHQRYGVGLSLLLADIDDFKAVNDQYGHQHGDRMLKALARTMVAKVRESDICCRFGGEEFVVILPFTRSSAEACDVAERIRVGATAINGDGAGITISVGAAVCGPSEKTPRALIEAADRALYEAKRAGKNRVVMAAAGGRPKRAPEQPTS
ncbi:MAG: GGDEF domain-containing protein [bacterium]